MLSQAGDREYIMPFNQSVKQTVRLKKIDTDDALENEGIPADCNPFSKIDINRNHILHKHEAMFYRTRG